MKKAIAIVIMQIVICFGLTVSNFQMSAVIEQQRISLISDICHLKHTGATTGLVRKFITYQITEHDFRDAWAAEAEAYLKACFGDA